MRIPETKIASLAFIVCLFGSSAATAQNINETTYVKRDGPTVLVRTIEGQPKIVIRMIGPVDVVKVEPYIDAKKGKKSGRLAFRVVLKNTSSEPRTYQVFGQGRTPTGGWQGGASKAPSKGKLDPGKETTASFRTGFEGTSLPNEIRVDVF